MKRLLRVCMLVVPILVVHSAAALAQGVTTSALSGVVVGDARNPLSGATVTAVHEPSGTRYGALTRADGRFYIPGMRVGGPYRVTATFIGYETQERDNVQLALGVATDVEFVMRQTAVALEGITVTAEQNAAILSPDRTGAATSVTREALEVLPTLSRRIEDFARLTPQYSGAGFGFSFAGQDNRLNNVTVDGSYFNNSFGLAGQPGDRTNVAPISLDAIEQVQINIAPYDVRQGNFVGAGVNSVTRSGTNQFAGSLRYDFRDQGLMGDESKGRTLDRGEFDFREFGGWLSGPIIPNRLFFFTSLEREGTDSPGTTFRANTGGQTVGDNITRVLASDLDQLSSFLQSNFGYDPGPYQGYTHERPATRFLAKLDYNLDERNKLSLRYNHLDSETDVLASNSSSLGFGTRRSTTNALNFRNSNYSIMENIRSVVGEWNSIIGANMANNLIIGYSHHDESRGSRGDFFPFVDILDGSSVYTSFGFEPFTPNNELRYGSFQLQNSFTRFGTRHTLTFGVSAERYKSENVFFPGSQSVYTYNSLQDFYTDANDYLANPNRTQSPVTLRRFQLRWANIPGMEKPVQPLEVFYAGIYGQDEWQVNNNLRVTAGIRIEAPFFGNTGFENPNADRLTFRDEDGNPVQYGTSDLPSGNLLFSPRVGFNWDVTGDRTTQLRGGTGIFTGRPAYVWISNQIGNTGVLTGFESLDNTRARPFHPDPNHYKPSTVTGAPATAYELALTDKGYRYPQLWRSNIAVDQRLPLGLIGTAEFLYNRDVNGTYYINANLPAPQSQFNGVDNRPRWVGPGCGGAQPVSPCVTRLNNQLGNQVSNAIVLKNQSEGYSWNLAGSLERAFRGGFFVKTAYSYGEAKNTVDPGSIAFGSWNNNQHSSNPNTPGLGFASTSPGHRAFLALSYRREYFRFGATTLSLFGEGRTGGNASYVFSGDMNGDGGTSNDLVYIHANTSEMNFQTYTQAAIPAANIPARTFTAAEQAAAWNAFIEQDPYLSKNRGRYAERNAVFLPMVYRADASISQEIFRNIGGRRNGLQLRADIQNVTNLINKDWGVGQRMVTTSPLLVPTAAQGGPADANGVSQYRLRSIVRDGQHTLIDRSFEPTLGFSDVYQVLISVRYTFN